MNPIKVILADDHLLVRNGIKALLENEESIEVVAEASDGEEALVLARKLNPDVVIFDIHMPNMSGLEALKLLKKYVPSTKALMLSMHDAEEYILQAIEYGAKGYVLKDTNEKDFIEAIKKVSKGEQYYSGQVSDILAMSYVKSVQESKNINKLNIGLTRKEKEVLQLIAQGLSSKDMGKELKSSVRTIQVHRFNIMKKLKVKNVVELLKVAQENNLIQ
jgi:DNA-binding NarL/FixJ family response regulator